MSFTNITNVYSKLHYKVFIAFMLLTWLYWLSCKNKNFHFQKKKVFGCNNSRRYKGKSKITFKRTFRTSKFSVSMAFQIIIFIYPKTCIIINFPLRNGIKKFFVNLNIKTYHNFMASILALLFIWIYFWKEDKSLWPVIDCITGMGIPFVIDKVIKVLLPTWDFNNSYLGTIVSVLFPPGNFTKIWLSSIPAILPTSFI